MLPTTPTGKVDRGRLPLTDRTRPALDAVFVRPRSERERSLARIWQEVLHIDKIGIDDNFFDLGGNSLRLAEVNRKVRHCFRNGRTPLMEMLALPTIRTLAEYLTRPQDKLAIRYKKAAIAPRPQSVRRAPKAIERGEELIT